MQRGSLATTLALSPQKRRPGALLESEASLAATPVVDRSRGRVLALSEAQEENASPATLAWRERTEVITPIDHALVVEAANEVVLSIVEKVATIAGDNNNMINTADNNTINKDNTDNTDSIHTDENDENAMAAATAAATPGGKSGKEVGAEDGNVPTPGKSVAQAVGTPQRVGTPKKSSTPLQDRFQEVMAKSARMLSPAGSARMTKAMETEKARAEAAEAEVAQLKAVLHEFTRTVDEIEARSDGLAQQVAQLEARNKRYEDENMVLELGFKEWKGKALAAQEKLEQMGNAQLAAEADHKAKTSANLKTILKLESKVESLEETIASLKAGHEANIGVIQGKLKMAESKANSLQDQNAELTQICDSLLEQLEPSS